MRPQAGVDRLKPGPPMHANELPAVGQAFFRNLQYYSNWAERASLHKYRCRIFLDFQRWAIWRIGRTGHFQPKQLILQVPSFRLPQHITSHLLTLGANWGAFSELRVGCLLAVPCRRQQGERVRHNADLGGQGPANLAIDLHAGPPDPKSAAA